jgi:hypothetical protein
LTNSKPRSLGGRIGFSGFRDRWECNSDRRLGIDFPDTDFERGENSLKSNSMPRTKVRKAREDWSWIPDDAVFLIEFM